MQIVNVNSFMVQFRPSQPITTQSKKRHQKTASMIIKLLRFGVQALILVEAFGTKTKICTNYTLVQKKVNVP